MGCIAPLPVCDERLRKFILKYIMYPVIKGMSDAGTPYRGVLCADLMLTPDGPSVLEINCRFGDPDLQTVLALLEDDFLPRLEATVDGNVCRVPPRGELPRWRCGRKAVCLVVAARRYDVNKPMCLPISGIDKALEKGVYIIHAGTKRCPSTNNWLTNGDHVLNVVASAPSFPEARERVYDAADCINFGGRPPQYRTDIAACVPATL